MKKYSEAGAGQVAVIVAALSSTLFILTLTFAIVTYLDKQNLEQNIDQEVEKLMVAESKKIEAKVEAEYQEKEKSPVKTYVAPSTLGSVAVDYPKTYSAYVAESTGSSVGSPVDGYFHPSVVPKEEKDVVYALRMQIVSSPYETLLKQFENAQKNAKVTIKAFRPAELPDELGVRIDGEIATGKQGSMILIPVRDKTLKLWTESTEFKADFDTYVVPSITFVP